MDVGVDVYVDVDVSAGSPSGSGGAEVTVHALQPRKKVCKKSEGSAVSGKGQKQAQAQVQKQQHSENKGDEVQTTTQQEVVSIEMEGVEVIQGNTSMSSVHKLQPRKKMKKAQNTASQTKKNGTKGGAATKKPASGVSANANANANANAKKGNSKPGTASKTNSSQKQAATSTLEPPPLSPEDAALISKYDAMKTKYVCRAKELIERGLNNSLPEEDFQAHGVGVDVDDAIFKSASHHVEAKDDTETIEFRDEWISELAVIVQGSSLPIDKLARIAQHKIATSLMDSKSHVSVEAVASKIKLIAERAQYLFAIPDGIKRGEDAKVHIFSDTNSEFLWRWELISVDYLPNEFKATVKKARAARRKLKNHQKAVTRLIQAIIDVVVSISSQLPAARRKKLAAKLSVEEERVLKYEREEEKLRLLIDAKKQKIAAAKRLEEERKKEKERLEEAKKAEMAILKAEKDKLLVEKEKKKKEALLEKEHKEMKQKSRMLSFFKAPTSTSKYDASQDTITCSPEVTKEMKPLSFDSEKLWSSIGSKNAHISERPFPTRSSLSLRALRSKRRKINTVNVRVFVPTVSDNPFQQDVYDEERILPIRNRYKYLSFREDHRPPYHGTWSKPMSSIISGRKPLCKDTAFLDYDVDSEAEWEEGDDDQGEDCSENGNDDEDMIDDEEGDTTKYNYQDGWLAEDCDLVLEDDDEETKEFRKKKVLQSGNESDRKDKDSKFTAACVIAPLKGGIPQAAVIKDLIEGVTIDSAQELFDLHQSEHPSEDQLCLDPFPPTSRVAAKKLESTGGKSSTHKMTREDLIIFAKFVHNSNHKSKDMVIEALRNTHKDITSSRAQATRKLDSIATKRRRKNGKGVVWEVNNDVLVSLGLQDLVKEIEMSETGPIEELKLEKKKKVTKRAVKSTTKTATKSGSRSKIAKKPSKNVNSATPSKSCAPALVSPKTASPSRKRKDAPVSKATVNLLASFLKKKTKT